MNHEVHKGDYEYTNLLVAVQVECQGQDSTTPYPLQLGVELAGRFAPTCLRYSIGVWHDIIPLQVGGDKGVVETGALSKLSRTNTKKICVYPSNLCYPCAKKRESHLCAFVDFV